MALPAGSFLFLLGLASGVALLAITGYRHASPAWLRAVLLATGVGLLVRYVAFANAANIPHAFPGVWDLMALIGFTCPAIFAIDALIRHPAMTPRRLLRWYAPCVGLAVAAAWLSPVVLRIVSWILTASIAGIAVVLAQQPLLRPVRLPLLGLAAGMVLTAIGGLTGEMVALLLLWYAYETAARLQQGS